MLLKSYELSVTPKKFQFKYKLYKNQFEFTFLLIAAKKTLLIKSSNIWIEGNYAHLIDLDNQYEYYKTKTKLSLYFKQHNYISRKSKRRLFKNLFKLKR